MQSIPKGRKRWWLVAIAAVAASGLVAAACGGDDDVATATTAPGTTATATVKPVIDYAKLSGEVRIDGSSTVFPISEAVAEEFSKVAKNVKANVAFSGTGGGFEKFCRGEIQVSDASRPIKQSEKDACAKNNITDVVELQVAIDALTVVVNPSNTWAKCVTPVQLQKLFKDGGATKWSDIDPAWPAENIKFFYPGTDSGTFDYFKEAIITLEGKDKVTKHRGDGTASEDDNVLLTAVEKDKNAIAYFGFAYYEEAGKKLKALEIDNGAGCVPPTSANALSGKYAPLSRPLFIYTREALLKERPEVLGFVKFYMDNVKKLVPDVGYVSMPDATLKTQQDKLTPFLPK